VCVEEKGSATKVKRKGIVVNGRNLYRLKSRLEYVRKIYMNQGP